jgi:hypothetical protein
MLAQRYACNRRAVVSSVFYAVRAESTYIKQGPAVIGQYPHMEAGLNTSTIAL